MALAISEDCGTRAREGARKPSRQIPKFGEFHPSCLDSDENRWGADLLSALTRLEGRVHGLEGQGLRSDRRASELAGLAQALTEEQRALLIRLDRLEDVKQRRDTVQVPEDRLGRLEQEHRTLALELRLTVSVAEEAQQKNQQRMRWLEESLGARLRKLEQGAPDGEGRNWWPDVSSSREALEASRLCEGLEAKVGGLSANVLELQRQLQRAEVAREPVRSRSPSPMRLGEEPLTAKLEHLENFCCELRETLEDRLMLVMVDLERQVPDLLEKYRQQAEDAAERAEKLQELEVRVEMLGRRVGTQDERLHSCSERAEKIVGLPQLRSLCREELQKRLSEEDLLGTASAVAKQQDVLNEVQLQVQRLMDRLQLVGLRQAIPS